MSIYDESEPYRIPQDYFAEDEVGLGDSGFHGKEMNIVFPLKHYQAPTFEL